ncbi:hypothetical protein [Paenibacillus selenitireducens]|uniref:hypothetical protein n=1 Tax=Paenibacillus selenitireducens TaxID=1324314 RepID=UPI00117F7BD9|nr:hypothetical protein [Paenibacillus selenitireducens]
MSHLSNLHNQYLPLCCLLSKIASFDDRIEGYIQATIFDAAPTDVMTSDAGLGIGANAIQVLAKLQLKDSFLRVDQTLNSIQFLLYAKRKSFSNGENKYSDGVKT